MILGMRVFEELDVSRRLWIGGDLGGGKTRLAFDLALPYWRKGYNVVSNVPHNFSLSSGPFGVDIPDLYKSFVIGDEAGEYIREQKFASALTRSLSKADYYWVSSGARSPHKFMCDFQIFKIFDFWNNYGVPLLLWRATLFMDTSSKSGSDFLFWQWMPSTLHGTYSTLAPSADMSRIFQLASRTIDRLAKETDSIAGEAVQGVYDDAPQA